MTIYLPIYLDYMATTPVDPRVAKRMMAYLTPEGDFGNPASRTHIYGKKAAEAVDHARQQVADLVGCQPDALIWTSGATEANNLAIKGAARFYQRQRRHIVTCQTEHKAVLDPCAQLEREGFEVTYLPVQPNGLLDLNQLAAALRDDTLLLSVMHANNETGVIQDIAAIGALARQRGTLFHVDAAQSIGKIPVDLNNLPVDLMSFSAHKLYGPKGIGALYVRQKPRVRLVPLSHGGGQESGLRPGTLPVHQVVGMGEACEIARYEMPVESRRLLRWRERLRAALQTREDIHINGDITHRLPGNLNVSFAGIDGQILIESLSDLAISSGSACTSGNLEPSHVLRAMGVHESLARSAIRFSLGRFTTEEELNYTTTYVCEKYKILRTPL
jgi:cysteine desulfurase